MGTRQYSALHLQRARGRCSLRTRAAPGAVHGLRHGVEGRARLPHLYLAASGAGADAQSAGLVANAAAGSAGDDTAGRILAAADIRSGHLAAASPVFSGTGCGYFYYWVWRRDWGDVQDDAYGSWPNRW